MSLTNRLSDCQNQVHPDSVALISAYKDSVHEHHRKSAQRLGRCLTKTEWLNLSTGEINNGHFHCNMRVCPICQRRKQRALLRGSEQWIVELLNHGLRFLYLSVGFQNVPVDGARKRLDEINGGIQRLVRSKQSTIRGSFISREFTIADDSSVHFNIHSLLGVEPEYFNRAAIYLDHAAWCRLIADKLDLTYLPSVHIRPVDGHDGPSIHVNFRQVLDYILKPQDFSCNPVIGIQLADQLHGTRRFSYTGLFKTVRSSLSTAL